MNYLIYISSTIFINPLLSVRCHIDSNIHQCTYSQTNALKQQKIETDFDTIHFLKSQFNSNSVFCSCCSIFFIWIGIALLILELTTVDRSLKTVDSLQNSKKFFTLTSPLQIYNSCRKSSPLKCYLWNQTFIVRQSNLNGIFISEIDVLWHHKQWRGRRSWTK